MTNINAQQLQQSPGATLCCVKVAAVGMALPQTGGVPQTGGGGEPLATSQLYVWPCEADVFAHTFWGWELTEGLQMVVHVVSTSNTRLWARLWQSLVLLGCNLQQQPVSSAECLKLLHLGLFAAHS